MKSSRRDFSEVHTLIELAIEGSISPEQSCQLNDWIVNDPEIRRYYCEYIQLTVSIEQTIANIPVNGLPEDDMVFDREWWNQLAREEKTAPELAISSDQSGQELIQKVVYPPKEKHKLSKFSIFMLLNTAAIVLLFLFLKYAPPKGGFEVATLTDSLDAKWANVSLPMETGSRIVTGNERLLLYEGYVKLLFDNHTLVTIEGPAEFQILAEDRIRLNYGKVYSSVPDEAIGFSVYTQNAKIIDMGTEFAVLAELGGHTQLHVLKGTTLLMAGGASKVNMEVNEGSAKTISGEDGEISDVECRYDYFVRDIHSESNVVWRGQDRINLADIVGGGNGFGTGTVDMTIDPISGKPSKELWGRREAANDYRLVSSSPYIDGVFIPNGRTRQIISSEGHLFQECPATSGLCCDSLIYTEMMLDSLVDQNMKVYDSPLRTLLLHSNMGITFDLQAIRNLLPGVRIVRFQSKFGIRKWTARTSASNADFWILIDGKLTHKKTQVKENSLFDVDIELSENDRFLTLIETDGGDPEGRIFDDMVLMPIDSDWGMFVEPVLMLETK